MDDFGSSLLAVLGDDNQHICTVIGAMSLELTHQNFPLSPIAYLGATCSSLDRLSKDPDTPIPTIDALLAILSFLIPRVPNGILWKKIDFLSELLAMISTSKPLSDDGVVSNIKCVSQLLTINKNVTWNDISPLYATLVTYITDFRPKVRRQAHLFTRDALQYFQGVPVLSPASEGITNVLEMSLSGAIVNSAGGPKGALEVLYVLDALKECLPFLSSKCATSVLKYYKTLLELGQPLVTRRIIDSLYLLCLHPSYIEFAPEVLLDLLCSIAVSASTSKTAADNMSFTCRLLAAGMEKICALNRDICVVKLPVVFKALKDILGSDHLEAAHASSEALKKLIHSCIDESMIKQGKDRLMGANVSLSREALTTIEKLCAVTDSLLHYPFTQACEMSFQVVSAMFEKLGDASYFLMSGTVKNLSELQMLPHEGFSLRKQLYECIGSAVGVMGPEMFLSIIPLNLESDNQSESNICLFPILKKHTVGANLSFYCHTILPMIGQLKRKAKKLESEGHMFSSRTTNGLICSLWSLFPSFCNYPVDTAKSFSLLEEHLCLCLSEQPDSRGLICSGLHLLIEQNKMMSEGRNDSSDTDLNTSTQRAMAYYTADVASENLRVLASSGRRLLSVLTDIFLNSDRDGGCLQSVISEIASIAPVESVSDIYIRVMRCLFIKTKDSKSYTDSYKNRMPSSQERAQLFDLAASLLPKLIAENIYGALEPMLQLFWPRHVVDELLNISAESDYIVDGHRCLEEDDGLIQKKAYKALAVIFKDCASFVSSKHSKLQQQLKQALPSCHFSANRRRLDCIYFLIKHHLKSNSEQLQPDIDSDLLTEIILALKEANKKTRNRAYDVLVQIAHVYMDEDKGQQFFCKVAGFLAKATPDKVAPLMAGQAHKISAAIKGLARLTYEFPDLVSAAYELLPSVYVLMQRNNKEIIKANLGLLKVLVAKSPADVLHAHLQSMVVNGLLFLPDNSKNQFKSKIKLLIEMLVNKCGLDAVKDIMPEEHMKLLTNIRKLKDKKERRTSAGSEKAQSHLSKAPASRLSGWNHSRIFSDFDHETEGSDGEHEDVWEYSSRHNKGHSLIDPKASWYRSKRLNKEAKRLPGDLLDQLDDEPLDLLDRRNTRLSLRGNETLKRKSESDDEFEMDAEGRLIINVEGMPKKKKLLEDNADTRSRATRTSSHKMRKCRKLSDSSKSYVGSEYASRKAGGDVNKNDKLEPYAYWPLDRKILSRKEEHCTAAKRGMASVVKLTKKLQGKSVKRALSISKKKFTCKRYGKNGSKK